VITDIIIGAIIGLFLGPLIYVVSGLAIIALRRKGSRKKVEDIKLDYQKDLKKIKKQYRKKHKKYMKLRDKIIKYVDEYANKEGE
jgi:chaperonin cofactor prefoldin